MADETAGEHWYLTLDEANQNHVLELVRVAGPKMYVRSDGDWQEIDPAADNPRVWDRVIVDVDQSAADIYDQASGNDVIDLSLFDSAVIPDKEEDDQQA